MSAIYYLLVLQLFSCVEGLISCYFFVRCCQNGCRFLTFVATEFTDGSVSLYWLLIVFVVAAGFRK